MRGSRPRATTPPAVKFAPSDLPPASGGWSWPFTGNRGGTPEAAPHGWLNTPAGDSDGAPAWLIGSHTPRVAINATTASACFRRAGRRALPRGLPPFGRGERGAPDHWRRSYPSQQLGSTAKAPGVTAVGSWKHPRTGRPRTVRPSEPLSGLQYGQQPFPGLSLLRALYSTASKGRGAWPFVDPKSGCVRRSSSSPSQSQQRPISEVPEVALKRHQWRDSEVCD